VYKAVAVLWKVRKYYPQMYIPYELVEIILRHTVEPPVSPLPPKVTEHEQFDSDEDFELELEWSSSKHIVHVMWANCNHPAIGSRLHLRVSSLFDALTTNYLSPFFEQITNSKQDMLRLQETLGILKWPKLTWMQQCADCIFERVIDLAVLVLGLAGAHRRGIDIKHPIKCAASSQYIAVSAQGSGLYIF
jgi:hypothetical protein